MAGFELSYMTSGTSTAAIRTFLTLIDDFNRTHPQADVQVHNMIWGEAWQQLMRVAIYKKGPALSELGAPWTSDFVSMNSLRPFQPAEIAPLGGEAAFAPAAWKNCQVSGSSQCWGIPARVDVRVIFYWRDMVEQAGIDPAVGFSTPASLADSLACLRAAGMEHPFSMQIDTPRANVYHAASWIWGMGGELVENDGRVAFHQPAAQAGLSEFFQLFPYLDPGDIPADNAFLTRRSAVTMSGAWIIGRMRRGELVPWSPERDARLGVALPPGPSFVGGTNLAIWSHAGHSITQTGLSLIEHLLNAPTYPQVCIETDFLPPRLADLAEPALSSDPHYAVLVEALHAGRSHSSAHLWVLLAERLGSAMLNVWHSLRQDPACDVPALVREMTESVAARLDQALTVH